VNTTNTTTIEQLTNGQGVNALCALTGAQIVYDDNANKVTMVFKKQAGPRGAKLTHLQIAYNTGTDLYDITAYKLNKKTFQMPTVKELDGCYGDMLNEVCERITDLCLRF
jgi:hypothetical protein